MEKKGVVRSISLLIALFCLTTFGAVAQNVQFHYDFGSALYNKLDNRPKLTTTVEMFKPDKWGSTFFFVDMDYADGGVASAYWEIARELKFWQAPISFHVEYNGGIKYINNAYLGGLTYTWNNKDFSKGFSVSAMYKYIQKNEKPNNFQLTGVWHVNFAKDICSFTGFIDFWREKHLDFNNKEHKFVLLAEPQFWVNLNKFKKIDDAFKLSIGTEWEFSNFFAVMDGFYWNPTLAIKWTF